MFGVGKSLRHLTFTSSVVLYCYMSNVDLVVATVFMAIVVMTISVATNVAEELYLNVLQPFQKRLLLCVKINKLYF